MYCKQHRNKIEVYLLLCVNFGRLIHLNLHAVIGIMMYEIFISPCHLNNSLIILSFLESLPWSHDTILDTGTVMINQFLHSPVCT